MENGIKSVSAGCGALMTHTNMGIIDIIRKTLRSLAELHIQKHLVSVNEIISTKQKRNHTYINKCIILLEWFESMIFNKFLIESRGEPVSLSFCPNLNSSLESNMGTNSNFSFTSAHNKLTVILQHYTHKPSRWLVILLYTILHHFLYPL